jgi:hypothetical protein
MRKLLFVVTLLCGFYMFSFSETVESVYKGSRYVFEKRAVDYSNEWLAINNNFNNGAITSRERDDAMRNLYEKSYQLTQIEYDDWRLFTECFIAIMNTEYVGVISLGNFSKLCALISVLNSEYLPILVYPGEDRLGIALETLSDKYDTYKKLGNEMYYKR